MNLIPMGAGCAVDFLGGSDFLIHEEMKMPDKYLSLVKLHGKCTLEFIDEGEVVDSLSFDNTMTAFVDAVINKGNFFNTIPSNKLFPLLKFFQGVQLLSKNGDAAQMTIPGDARVVACANNASGSDSTDLRRGNYNIDASSVLLDDEGRINGYKFVWYWPDTRGNNLDDEAIKAVCLTRAALAIARYESSLPPDGNITEVLNTFEATETLSSCQLIDYENECAYWLTVASQAVTIKKYQLDTKRFHIMGVFDSDGAYDVTKLLAQKTISATVADLHKASVSLVSGHVHLVTWNGTSLVDTDIDASDADPDNWTEISTNHSYSLGSGVSIASADTSNYLYKDIALYDSGYIWFVTSDNKIIKANLSNDADLTQYDMAVTTYSNNGPFVALPNGDWIKYGYGEDNVSNIHINFFHNGVVYAALDNYISPAGYGYKYRAINYTGNGTMIVSMPNSGRYNNTYYMAVLIPPDHVSTVWNINDNDHRKTLGLTMRVVYEITEEESES